MIKLHMLQKLGLGGKRQREAVSLGVPGAVWGWCHAVSMMAHTGFF